MEAGELVVLKLDRREITADSLFEPFSITGQPLEDPQQQQPS